VGVESGRASELGNSGGLPRHTGCAYKSTGEGASVSHPECLIERYGENLGRNQHHRADLQSGQLAQPAKDSVEPVARQARNSLTVQELSQDAAVSLLLCNEKLQRRQKPRVCSERRV